MVNVSVAQLTNSQQNNGEYVPVTKVTIVLGILIVLSVVGNSLVCWAFVIQPQLRRVLYYPVLNLAIADILCGLVAMTSYLAKKHVLGGKKEQIVCDLFRFSYFVTEYASVLSLTIISVDRVLAIIRPLSYNMTVTSKRMKVVLGLAWFDAVFISCLPFFWRKNSSDSNCTFRPTKAWSITVIWINVLLPFFIIFLCQTSIYAVAIKHVVKIEKQRQVIVLRADGKMSHRGRSSKTDAWEIERNATVSLSIVVGLFVICWGPSSFYYFLEKVNPANFSRAFGARRGTFNAAVKLLTFANSCFNPIIYAWMNKDFRRAFLRVLKRRQYRSSVEKKALHHSASSATHLELMKLNVSHASSRIRT